MKAIPIFIKPWLVKNAVYSRPLRKNAHLFPASGRNAWAVSVTLGRYEVMERGHNRRDVRAKIIARIVESSLLTEVFENQKSELCIKP